MQATKGPFSSRFLRLLLAYTIGVNVFGLVFAVSLAVASALHVDKSSAAGLIGGLAASALGILAGWRTQRLLRRFSR